MRQDTLDQIAGARKGRVLVFTNGVFDVLHAGHVRLLTQARALGDVLVVGLNTDASARRLGKGPDRPVNNLEDRMAVVAALKPVDFVVEFDEDTPVELIGAMRPDIHVKGGDYRAEDLPESAVVESYGGRVVVLPLLEGLSTTATLRKMQGE
jgi:glycerol-3-phosphate cytidylyltransferase